MKHYCGECGASVRVKTSGRIGGKLELTCEHDWVEHGQTDLWCPNCEDHVRPKEIPEPDHFECPDCGEVRRYA